MVPYIPRLIPLARFHHWFQDFPDAGKFLFGEGFEARIKTQSETAKTLLQAAQVGQRSSQFFRGRTTTQFRKRGNRWSGAQCLPQSFNNNNYQSRGSFKRRPRSFQGAQKRRWAEAGGEPLSSTPLPPLRTFQTGGDSYVEGPFKKRRLLNQNRPQGCIFHSPSLPRTPEVHTIPVGGNPLRVHLPALRFGNSPTGIHP